MTRLVRVDEDLSGQTIDVSTLPDGQARQSYISGGSLQRAKIIGDIRGSDILDIPCEGLDLSEAKTYGCRWDGSTVDETTIISPTTGGWQTEMTYELIRRHLVTMPARLRRLAGSMLDAHAQPQQDWEGLYRAARSLTEAKGGWDEINRLLEGLRINYPGVWVLVAQLFHWAQNERNQVICMARPTIARLAFSDGATYEIDAKKLPPLVHANYRYELDRYIEKTVGPSPLAYVPPRHVWTAAIHPIPYTYHGDTADFWLDPAFQTGTRAWY